MDEIRLRTVLHVEDEPHIRELVELSLALSQQLTVYSCDGGIRALELLPELMPDVVLLDAMMPEMDGPAVIAQMKAEPTLAHIPVIFMTAKAMPQEIEGLMRLGAAGVIAKPFRPATLEAEVTSLWRAARQVA